MYELYIIMISKYHPDFVYQPFGRVTLLKFFF